MTHLLKIFHHETLTNEAKIKLIKGIGKALNYEMAHNWTDQVVDDLVAILSVKDPTQ